MDSARHRRIAELFARARELAGGEREAYLTMQCAGEPGLRAEVESLLAHHAHADRAFPTDVLRREAVAALAAGDRVGPHHLVRPIGTGGMGEVWLAEQTEPIRRKVALKIVKRGMDTQQVVARFEAERQALAVMDHPAIAKVYDAGETSQGRPYFAMELVDGEPITAACDAQRLSVRERLKLFIEVCEGVQHAHQKGIIHRDLKPTNVLVSFQDGLPSPRIIDFGVAKATGARLTEQSMYTEQGVLIGTPEYMSPEQAELGGVDIDTRTDVYSLGMLLYELLVGALPFDPEQLRRESFDEIRRKVREELPSRPSTRVTKLGPPARKQAERRRTDPSGLRRVLSGDLDWITLKALEKDRSRRYASAAEMADDVRRHLRHEPVIASPPSVTYRAGKFVRRHRAGVLLTAAAGVLLLGSALAMAFQARRIATERDTARTASDFLVGLFEVSAPSEARGHEITARELLDRGAAKIEHELVGQPEVQARMMATIGGVYEDLGFNDEARRLIKRALEIRRTLFGDDHPDTLASIGQMGVVLVEQGKLDEAEVYYRQALGGCRRVLGDDHEQTLHAMNGMAILLHSQGRLDAAEPLFREGLESSRRVLGNDHPETLTLVNNLGLLLRDRGRLADAEQYCREALEGRRRVLGEDHPDTLASINNTGIVIRAQGKLDQAEPYYREALDGARRVLGADHRHTLISMSNLGDLLKRQGNHEEATLLLLEALEIARGALGNDHPDTLMILGNTGDLLRAKGDLSAAESYTRECLQRRRRVLGDDHHDTLGTINGLARILHAQGRLDEARTAYDELLERVRRVLGEDHPHTLLSINNLGRLLQAKGKLEEAETHFRDVLDRSRRVNGHDHPDTLTYGDNLGQLLVAQGRLEEAEPYLREALEGRRLVLGENHPRTLNSMNNLGRLFQARGMLEEAESYYREAADGLRRKLGDHHPRTRAAITDLLRLYEGADDGERAAEWRAILQQAGAESGESDS